MKKSVPKNQSCELYKFFPFLMIIVFRFSILNAQQLVDKSVFSKIDSLTKSIENKVIEWRRDFHQHPELSNRETRTSSIVAAHLKRLGLKVETGIAHTGVVAVLEGNHPGPVVALRADMDALPVTEEVNLPFASKERTTYEGKEVGVMHACGHDVHTSILMGVAETLSKMKDKLRGKVKFIFQPAEEGAPEGEEGGAELMSKEGVFENLKPDLIFGLHTMYAEVGKILYAPGPTMASADNFSITVHGRGSHGAAPWLGIDPIVAAAQIVLGLQTIVSRQADLTEGAAVITVGTINGGTRHNIIPDYAEMTGTIRALNETTRNLLHERIKNVSEQIAKSFGATANVEIQNGYPVTVNNKELAGNSVKLLKSILGEKNIIEITPKMMAEDFSYFANKIQGFYFFIGIASPGTPADKIEANHSPRFYVDERAILFGMRSLAYLTVNALSDKTK